MFLIDSKIEVGGTTCAGRWRYQLRALTRLPAFAPDPTLPAIAGGLPAAVVDRQFETEAGHDCPTLAAPTDVHRCADSWVVELERIPPRSTSPFPPLPAVIAPLAIRARAAEPLEGVSYLLVRAEGVGGPWAASLRPAQAPPDAPFVVTADGVEVLAADLVREGSTTVVVKAIAGSGQKLAESYPIPLSLAEPGVPVRLPSVPLFPRP